jgi:hypothetical protein
MVKQVDPTSSGRIPARLRQAAERETLSPLACSPNGLEIVIDTLFDMVADEKVAVVLVSNVVVSNAAASNESDGSSSHLQLTN